MSVDNDRLANFQSRASAKGCGGGEYKLTAVHWRGFGGGKPTLSTVKFDQQLDKICLWLENWDHDERCAILEAILERSRYSQLRFLWTVTQPALHRDFMYTAKLEFPSQQFVPISSFFSRKLRDRQLLRHENTYHRITSAHLQHPEQLKDVLQEIKLPDITSPVTANDEYKETSFSSREKSLSHSDNSPRLRQRLADRRPKLQRSVTWSSVPQQTESPHLDVDQRTRNAFSSQSVTMHQHLMKAASLDRQNTNTAEVLHSAPPCFRYIDMPPRRHIQEQEVPGYLDTHQGSSLSNLSELSLRDRKRNKENPQLRRTKTDVSMNSRMSAVSEEGCKLIHWYLDIWDDSQRNEFLHKILLKLDPRQHYFISGFLVVHQYKDFISLLPEKLALKILAYLSPNQILRASLVCKKWKDLCNNNELWRIKCSQVTLVIPVSQKPKWKKILYDNRRVKNNWSEGKCSTVDCKGHTDRVLSVTFDGQRMATGSVDKTIRVWNLDTGKCLQILKGHLRGIWCVKFFTKHLLISGSYDAAIKVWNLRESSCVRTLLGHESSVWALARRGNILASGSQDRTARIWDVGRCVLLHTLTGHHGAVFCIDMDERGRVVITGSNDKTVRLWDVETGQQRRVIMTNERSAVMAVSYSHGFLACSFLYHISLYRISIKKNTAKKIQTYSEHIKRIESLELIVKPDKGSGTLISGGKDGVLKYWDITKDKSVQTYRGHRGTINCVHCDELRIVTASYDNKIKIWDFRPS